MNKTIASILLACSFVQLFPQESSIEEYLHSLSDITYKAIDVPKDYREAFEIKVKQPLDHNNPAAGYFYQKVYLSHKSMTKPTVMVTEGYECPGNHIYELSTLLDANQIEVEHRYFGSSVPDSLDYKYLNLEQVTADLHYIRELFNTFYTTKKWISTGISKGGQTTIYYRYFYPNDVTVSVPYVAPFNRSLEDKRIYTFLDTVGSADCREKIKAFQVAVLQKRDSVLPILQNFSYENDLKFTYLSLQEAFEYTVLEYSFSFWQWGNDCNKIPDKCAPVKVLVSHLLDVSTIGFFSDAEMKAYASHYYQAATEMGYYGYDISYFDTLIKALPKTHNPLATFAPEKMYTTFDSTLSYKAFNWLQNHGNNFIYLYGASDTWSATAVPPSSTTNSLWYFIPGKNHATARICYMSNQQQQQLLDTLEFWLKIDIKESNLKALSKISGQE
jgi:hypothetical protein